ncbi:MAG: MFS transporter [Gammaproteobacteria bacterium]|nr:MFS transporter [Gammaproteobacteria bacterium]NIV49680.1 MFS transporter [Gammaproteobacteria bacterium]NIW57078.1 MFS transporter [Gammaproteobacteria bacterium]
MTMGNRLEFFFLNLGHFYDHLFILIYATVAALVLPSAFDMSYGELIIYATPGFIAFGAFALPAGWLADRWSRRGMMIIFFIGLGISAMLTGLARTPLEIGAGLFLVGMFAAIYHPVGITMVVEARPVKTGVALGINGVWGNMGVACAAIVAGSLIDLSGWRAAFVVPGVTSVATGIAYALMCRSHARSGIAASAGSKREPVVLDKRLLVKIFVIIALTTTLGSYIFQSMTFSLPKILEERLSDVFTSATAVGGSAFLVFAIASMAQILIGHLVDRHSIRTVFAFVAGLQVPAYLLAVGLSGVPVIIGAIAFMLLVFGQIPINDALLSRITTPEYRSRIYAVKFVLSFSVAAAAIPLVALLHETTGFDGLLTAMAAVAGIIFLCVLGLPRIGVTAAPTVKSPA